MSFKKLVDALKNRITKRKKETGALEGFQARIIVSTLSYSNLGVVADENGESHIPFVPAPVEEEFLVKNGEQVKGFEVSELTANFIVLKSSVEYTEDNASTPKTQFIIEKAGSINLRMCGVYDAVHRITIKYCEAVALGDC